MMILDSGFFGPPCRATRIKLVETVAFLGAIFYVRTYVRTVPWQCRPTTSCPGGHKQ